ncbi:MAG: hypothetical protein VXW22_13950, partial [Pseudomonadota bacterium]|nr:hypothetical protein [Pseudomonadota bacterium]
MKPIIGFVGLGLLAACQTTQPAQSAPMDARSACEQTINDYAWHLDHPGTDLDATAVEFSELFTDD